MALWRGRGRSRRFGDGAELLRRGEEAAGAKTRAEASRFEEKVAFSFVYCWIAGKEFDLLTASMILSCSVDSSSALGTPSSHGYSYHSPTTHHVPLNRV